jgi:rod shape-determining protein MreD
MIVTRRIAIRLALILFVAVLLQISFFSYLSFFGSIPDLTPVVVASLGLLGGAVVGAVAGFCAGMVVDSALLQTLGVSSLALLAIGYMAGRYREGYEFSNSLAPPLIVGGLTLAYAAIFAALQIMLGVSTPVSLVILRDVVVKGLLGFLLALAIYPLVRRIVRPALVDDAAAGRRAPVRAGAPRRRAPWRRARRGARRSGILAAGARSGRGS